MNLAAHREEATARCGLDRLPFEGEQQTEPPEMGVGAEDRAALFRLAWDFVGTGLAGRGFLYERFYLTSAARHRARQHLAVADRTLANSYVDQMLELAR